MRAGRQRRRTRSRAAQDRHDRLHLIARGLWDAGGAAVYGLGYGLIGGLLMAGPIALATRSAVWAVLGGAVGLGFGLLLGLGVARDEWRNMRESLTPLGLYEYRCHQVDWSSAVGNAERLERYCHLVGWPTDLTTAEYSQRAAALHQYRRSEDTMPLPRDPYRAWNRAWDWYRESRLQRPVE